MEEWKSVVGNTNYEVSSEGRVRNLKSGKLIGYTDDQGYRRVYLSNPGTRGRVHQLVAQAFIPNPEGHELVRHLNDDPGDNRVENLAWGTVPQNSQDMLDNGKCYARNLTHCKRGHRFNEQNTIVASGSRQYRSCRSCRMADTNIRRGFDYPLTYLADCHYRALLDGWRGSRWNTVERMVELYG